MGTSWQDTPDESALLSVGFFLKSLPIQQQFFISMAVALAVKACLKHFGLSPTIKWPNDLYCNGHKIAGILIENQLVGATIQNVVVGVGINVNQASFPGLPHATSIFLCSGHKLAPRDVALQCIDELEMRMDWIHAQRFDFIKKNYLQQLYGVAAAKPVMLPDGSVTNGIVRDVTSSGRIVMAFESGETADFDIKEVQWQLPLR